MLHLLAQPTWVGITNWSPDGTKLLDWLFTPSEDQVAISDASGATAPIVVPALGTDVNRSDWQRVAP